MRATEFESRHRTLLHRLIVLAAFLTYLVDPDDIVWRFIKDAAGDVRLLERILFAIATLLFGVAACLCTRSRAHCGRKTAYIGEFLYAVALGSLVPLAGFVILVAGEAIRLLRLARRPGLPLPVSFANREALPWSRAIRAEAVKWGLFLTMIVFTMTLKDRIAEILAGVSVFFAIILNIRGEKA